jgi:DNA-binding CsgD family transcriptional regulator
VAVFGDVVRSRASAIAATRWLDRLRGLLVEAYAGQTLASFEFTQGDEIQGLLSPDADPLRAVLISSLRSRAGTTAAPRMRWAIASGAVDPGSGPATRRTGEAFLRARATLERADRQRDGLLCATGQPSSDALLDDVAPVLMAHIDRMTDRQREIARLTLVEGLRQSEAADLLRVSRPTVSIAWRRADVRSLGRLVDATRRIWSSGVEQARAERDGR